jgi:hypothetical protein
MPTFVDNAQPMVPNKPIKNDSKYAFLRPII